MAGMRWEHAACDAPAAQRLADALGIEPVVARLLCMRGLSTPELADRFLNPSLDHLHDPFRLAGMREAVERLLGAIARRERIAVHGDYDVDGVTSTVMLRRTLDLLGADVVHFIPDRLKDGYGLQPAAIERLAAMQVRVVVSVDCGIRGDAAAARARDLGVDLIITDHHEPGAVLPPAFAILNPKRADCGYPEKNLAGVGVALKLVQALCQRTGRDRWLPAFVKMAAIGTLADVVPLLGENRVIAKLGLEELSRGRHTVGLRALLEAAGLTGRRVDSYHVTFMLAPRVNAAGRMSSPDLATRLLLAADESLADEARSLAEQLNAENQRRQQEEAEIVADARRAIEKDPGVGAHNLVLVAGEGWHRGVIGIVASRLVDSFHRPAIVLSLDGGLAHGSCRSIPAFDMLGALERCADLLDRFGGHRQAAGLTLDREKLPAFRARICGLADAELDPDDLRPRLRLDAPLPLRGITGRLIEGLDRLAPFGMGNPKPVFHATAVEVMNLRPVKERHLRMTIRQEGRSLPAIAWRAAERAGELSAAGAWDLAFSLEQGSYRGETFVELHVADLQTVPLGAPAVAIQPA